MCHKTGMKICIPFFFGGGAAPLKLAGAQLGSILGNYTTSEERRYQLLLLPRSTEELW